MKHYDFEKVVGNYKLFAGWKDSRDGFTHFAEIDRYEPTYKTNVGAASIHYLNRTWESYRYQSVLNAAVRDAMNAETAAAVEAWKEANGKKRIPAAVRAELHRKTNESNGLTAIYNSL